MTGYRFLIFIVIVLLPFKALSKDSKNEVTDLKERIVKLEQLIHSDPFIYDIELREKIERSLVQQEEFTRRIPIIEKQLNELKNQLVSEEGKPSNNDIDKKLVKLKSELLELLEATTALHKDSLSTINSASNKTFQSASTAANEANKRFDQYLVVQSVILAIVGIVISIIAWFTHRKVNHIERVSDKAKRHLSNARKIYIKHKGEIENDKKSLSFLKKEILSLHKMLDVRENYNNLQSKHFSDRTFMIKVKQQASDLLDELLEINKLPSNGYEKELKANISYCSAILGIISFREGEFIDAYEHFVMAEKNNVHGHIDRLYNRACSASQIFQDGNKTEPRYLNEVVDCYIKLSSHVGQTRKLMNDSDITAIIDDIKYELQQRGETVLIIP